MQKGEQNKNGGTRIIHYSKSPKQKIGGDSASAKRSAEQKLVGGTKKRSAEQKLVSGTKIAEQKFIHYSESPKQKLVGTVQVQKGQQNKNWWALSAIG